MKYSEERKFIFICFTSLFPFYKWSEFTSFYFSCVYEGESVNTSQMKAKQLQWMNRFSMCITRQKHGPPS
jgi:hypothetical protein